MYQQPSKLLYIIKLKLNSTNYDKLMWKFLLTVMCSLFIELVASTEWEHLWENLVIASPGKSWKVPNEVGLWIAMFPGEGSATIINPWNLAGCSSCAPWKKIVENLIRSWKILKNMNTLGPWLVQNFTAAIFPATKHQGISICESSRTQK